MVRLHCIVSRCFLPNLYHEERLHHTNTFLCNAVQFVSIYFFLSVPFVMDFLIAGFGKGHTNKLYCHYYLVPVLPCVQLKSLFCFTAQKPAADITRLV